MKITEMKKGSNPSIIDKNSDFFGGTKEKSMQKSMSRSSRKKDEVFSYSKKCKEDFQDDFKEYKPSPKMMMM